MPSGSIHGFFRRFRGGDPVALVANIHDNDLIKNFIEGLCGCGCRVEKTTENGLLCCKIIVDGSSDAAAGEPPEAAAGRIDNYKRMVGLPDGDGENQYLHWNTSTGKWEVVTATAHTAEHAS